MKFSQLELPSNRKFGFFFTFIFSILAVYFYNVFTFHGHTHLASLHHFF